MKRTLLALLLLPLSLFAQHSPEEIAAANKAFEEAKGELLCPMESGSVDMSILYLSAERKPTEGLDVISNVGTVRACFDGVVVSAFGSKGDYSVIVSHGDYFTVYSEVAEQDLKSGQQLKQGEVIGSVNKDEHDAYRLHFEIWHNSDKLWPGEWILCGEGLE